MDKIRTNSGLTNHMRLHSNETPFKCVQCYYATFQIRSLNIHLMELTGGNPFKCTECNCSTKVKVSLGRYMSWHAGEKPYAS